jgi:protein TIF31
MTDEKGAVSEEIPSSETAPALSDEAAAPAPEPTLLKGLKILPPLQKTGTISFETEVQDAIPLPKLGPEEMVASLRQALSEILGFAHLTNYRFQLEKADGGAAPGDAAAKRKGKSSSRAEPSKYTGVNASISIPPRVKSLDEFAPKEQHAGTPVVLDEYGDLTPLLEHGLQDGSAFRIVLERYDAASVKDHVVRVRALLEGNAPSAETLDDGSGSQESSEKAEDASDGSDAPEHAKEEPPKGENDTKPEKGKQEKISAKDMPVFPDDKPLVPDTKDLKHFFYYACGEDPDLYLGEDKNCGNQHKRENGTKSRKKNKKSSSKANASSNGEDDEEADATNIKKQQVVREAIPQLNELEEKTRVPCSIKYSGFHPPPHFRRLMGDLAYLEATLPDHEIVCVTATIMGFYINRSTVERGSRYNFDPSPAPKHCFSHELLDCLLQYSPAFQTSWSEAVTASKRRAELMSKINPDGPFLSFFRVAIRGDFPGYKKPTVASASEGIDSLIQEPSWLVPIPRVESELPSSWTRNCEHVYNPATTEDDLSSSYGVDIRGGSLRDWNEELQVAREMPTTSLPERMERARVLNKVLTDFGEAALLGVKAISSGLVASMNPNEAARSQVYLHNNIFFSRAVDAGVDTFKVAKGDRAARKSASRDIQSLGALHRMEKPGLHTLATVLIDYLGSRYVCQSILPGILNGEKTHTLLYGAVEAGASLAFDKEMHELFESSIGKSLMVATRRMARDPLTPEKEAEVEAVKKASPLYLETLKLKEEEKKDDDKDDDIGPVMDLCAPVEAKGIRGSDSRKYVLDMTRITPRDANWVPKHMGGSGKWEALAEANGAANSGSRIPKEVEDDEWTLAVLRSELISGYRQMLMSKYIREKKATKAKDSEGKSDKSKGETEREKKGPSDEDLAYFETIRFNVNVFLPDIRTLEGIEDEAFELIKKDEELVREISSHLWDEIIPAVTREVREGSPLTMPYDGKNLTEFIHQRGINCRYLGRLAMLAAEEERRDRDEEANNNNQVAKLDRRRMPMFWLELLETEMVARAAKHVLDKYLSANGAAVAAAPAQTVASFLCALVSQGEETASQTETRMSKKAADDPEDDDFFALTFYQAGGEGDALPFPVRSRYDVWNDIEDEIGRRFRYRLSIYNRPGRNHRAMYMPLLRRVCQRTGVRLAARYYDVGGKSLCSDGGSADKIIPSYPISALDIVDIVPLMKHAAAHGAGFVPCGVAPSGGLPALHISLPDARNVLETAHIYRNRKNLSQALDLAQEAAGLYQRVTETPAHPGVVRCIDLMATILYEAGEPGLAASNASRALGYQVQISGFDSSDVINFHLMIFNYLYSAQEIGKAITHIRAATYLIELVGGSNHVELPSALHKAGTFYYGVHNMKTALRFYQEAGSRQLSDRLLEGMISKSSALVLVGIGDFKGAVQKEKQAFQLFSNLLGPDHTLTKQSDQALRHFLGVAARQGKGIVNHLEMQQKEEAANAIASEIEAEEAAAEEQRKKKNQKKKKGKK